MSHKGKITADQLYIINKIEKAFRDYYRDNITVFKGFTYQHASEWINSHWDEYVGVRGELERQRRRGLNHEHLQDLVDWLNEFIRRQYDCFGMHWYGIDIPDAVYRSYVSLYKGDVFR